MVKPRAQRSQGCPKSHSLGQDEFVPEIQVLLCSWPILGKTPRRAGPFCNPGRCRCWQGPGVCGRGGERQGTNVTWRCSGPILSRGEVRRSSRIQRAVPILSLSVWPCFPCSPTHKPLCGSEAGLERTLHPRLSTYCTYAELLCTRHAKGDRSKVATARPREPLLQVVDTNYLPSGWARPGTNKGPLVPSVPK